MAIRTRFFDDYLLAACAAGYRQVVVLAAGLDTRAFRLAWPGGVRLFELDLPEVFAFKEPVLAGRGARAGCQRVVVEADLRTDWPTVLVRDGDLRPEEPTVWLVEGILAYLTEEENDQLLSRIGQLSAPGSQLAFDHMNRNIQMLPLSRERADALVELGMSWQSVLEDPEAWLARYGWLGEVFDSAGLAVPYSRPVSPLEEVIEMEDAAKWWLVKAVREPA